MKRLGKGEKVEKADPTHRSGGREPPRAGEEMIMIHARQKGCTLTQQKTLEARFSSNWPMIILTSLS